MTISNMDDHGEHILSWRPWLTIVDNGLIMVDYGCFWLVMVNEG